MKRKEAVKRLDDGGEHKFVIRKESPVYIKERAREREIAPLLHEELVAQFIASGIFPDKDGVSGGYCKVEHVGGVGKLLYWGESSHPIKPATSDEFHSAVDNHGVILF